MERRAVLVAVAPAALGDASELLSADFALVPVRTLQEARARLARGGIDAIVSCIHFDDSRMPMLLDEVKHDPRTRDLPFICCRFLPTVLPGLVLHATSQACEALGAQDFIDVFELLGTTGAAATAERLKQCLQRAASSRSLAAGS